MDIKILGTGCKKCLLLEKNVRVAVEELGVDATIEKVTDVIDIMAYNVMSTPALVIDSKVVSTGLLLSTEQVKEYLK